MIKQETKNPFRIIGCGYLGKKLLNELIVKEISTADNISTVVKSVDSQQHCAHLGTQSIQLDLDSQESLLPEDLSFKQAIIYYFAPPPSQGSTDSRAQHFLRLLSQKLTQKPPHEQPKKIVLISTTGVYGHCHGQWITEESPLNPAVDRARRRVDAEQQFQNFCQKLKIPLVILRVSGIYGKGKLPIKRIKSQTPIVREEDSPFSNRIHADDLLEISLLAGLRDDIEGIFNCADGHPTTMCDYFMKVAEAEHLPAPPTITLEQARTQLSAGMLSYMEESRRIDNQKLLTTFKIRLKHPNLEHGLFQN
ncbi:MAG: NAD-dependent epimerase/dehydratase family protein [Gammaproteobacteria bacterium]|nr:NAD-dependent epimerase/dehydratase family protein [Gammaproteobacteria bacterium]